MEKVDNSRIEEVAVDEVNTYMSEKTRRISGKLEKSDTGISIDGDLIFYLEKERKVSTFGGEIPVQVKGKVVEKISINTSVYRHFDKDTYLNFLKLDGVLVFLVEEVFDDGLIKEKQIFYKYLEVVELISIINDLEKSGNKTKTLYLDKLDTDIDFDKVVDDVYRIRRKMPAFLGLYASYNKSNISLDNNILQSLGGVLEDVTKEIRKSDFYDDDSEFLKQAIPLIKEYLSKDFVFDYEDAVILANSFITNDNYNLLQNETKNLVLIFLAKISNYQQEFENAQSKLYEVDTINNTHKYYYERELFVANVLLSDDTDIYEKLDEVMWQNESDRELYKLFIEIESGKISTNELKKIPYHNDNLKYLIGTGYANNFNFLNASKMFSKIQENTSIKILEIMNYFRAVTEEILFEDNYSRMDRLKIYQIELREKLDELKQKGLTLEQGDLVYNLMLSFTEPQLFLEKELGESDENDKIIIQSLLITKNYQQVIDYLYDKILTDFNLLLYLFFSLVKEKKYDLVITKISRIIESKIKLPKEHLELLGDYFIDALINLKEIKYFDSIEELQKEYYFISDLHCMKIYLYKAEMNQNISDKELKKIKLFVKGVKTELDIGIICSFVSRYNNIQFAKEVWEELKYEYYEELSEAISILLLREGSEESLAFALGVIKWTEKYCALSKKLIMIECQVFSVLGQYKAILNRVNNIKEKDEDILNLQLIAQINLDYDAGIEDILEIGITSNNLDFKLNSGLGLMIFGIDPVKGSKILLRELIETNFQNVDLGQNFVLQSLNSLREFSDERELSKISGNRYYYYELTNEKKVTKLITIPSEWDATNLYGYEVIKKDNNFYFLLTRKRKNDSIKINNKNYKISKKIPLSKFAFNKMFQHCIGDVNSDKLIKSFSVEGTDFSEITNFMETESNNQLKLIKQMQKFNFTGFLTYLCSDEDIFNFIQIMYNDPEYAFNLGEVKIPENNKMQLSLSSLVLIKTYELEEVIENSLNIYIDLELKKNIEKLIRKEINQGYDIKKIQVIEGNPIIVERTEEEYDKQLEYLEGLLDIINKINNKNEAMFISPKLQEIFSYDANSVQSSIDNSHLLLIEDIVMQELYNGFSILGVIHHYFINLQAINIDRYLNFLLKLQESNNLYFFETTYKLDISRKVIELNDEKVTLKYLKWDKNQINMKLSNRKRVEQIEIR